MAEDKAKWKVPLLWKDVGKSVSDFFTKKFLSQYQVKLGVRPSGPYNLQFISTTTLDKDGKIASTINPKLKCDRCGGTAETEIDTNGDVNSKFTLDKYLESFEFRASHKSTKSATVGIGFKHPFLTSLVDVTFNAPQPTVDNKAVQATGSFIVGHDGLSVGVQGEYSGGVEKPTDRVTDFNVLVEYAFADTVASLKTEKKMSIVNANFETKVSPTITFFSQLSHLLVPPVVSAPLTTAQIGSQIKLDKDQLLKAKLTSGGLLGLQLETALVAASKLKLGTELDITKFSGGKVFAGLEFGDVD